MADWTVHIPSWSRQARKSRCTTRKRKAQFRRLLREFIRFERYTTEAWSDQPRQQQLVATGRWGLDETDTELIKFVGTGPNKGRRAYRLPRNNPAASPRCHRQPGRFFDGRLGVPFKENAQKTEPLS